MIERSPHRALLLALSFPLVRWRPAGLGPPPASELSELRKDLSELRQYNRDLRLRLQLAEARNKVLIDLVKGLTTNPDHYAPERRQLATADASLHALERDVNALVSTVRHSRSDVTALQAQRTQLQEELAQAKRTISEARAAHAETDARLATLRGVVTPLIEPIRAGKINVSVQYGQLQLQLPETALFDGRSSQLSAAGRSLLDGVAHGLKTAPERQAHVFGPAENARPGQPSGRQLSETRVLAVITYLATQGVARQSLIAASHAVSQPFTAQAARFFQITLIPEAGDRAVQPSTEQLLDSLKTPETAPPPSAATELEAEVEADTEPTPEPVVGPPPALAPAPAPTTEPTDP